MAVGDVAVHTGEELALGVGPAPGVGLEPPPPDGLDRDGEVLVVAGLFEGGVEFAIAALQDLGVGLALAVVPINHSGAGLVPGPRAWPGTSFS